MSKQEKEKQRLINELAKELEENNLAIFAGAGLSAPAGFVNWSQLLKPIAEELDLDVEKETDLVALAQYHCNTNQANRGKLNQLLIDEFAKNANPTQNHKILARLPISTYWTTNYDKLIENSLTSAGKIPDTKHQNPQLNYTKPNRDAIVYKMHGDIDRPDEAILTKDDYESYHVKMQPFLNALSGDLISKTFLFLGFSFTDPNLDYILSRVRIAHSKNQRQHFCIQRKVSALPDESQADLEYRERKQELFIQDLLRFSIKTILVKEYSEITEILKNLEKVYKQNTIFISGAAHQYGNWDKESGENFVYSLSKNLAKKDFRIVSGFGLGIGSSVITGVLEHVYMSGKRLDNEQLILRPFPQSQTGDRPLKDVWYDYRNDMIAHAGIAIFIFGNKFKEGKVVESNGMMDEFKIAKSQGAFLLPIGATGYVASSIYNQLEEEGYFRDLKISKEIRDKIPLLNNPDTSLEDLKDIILDIVQLVNKHR
jgi:Sir2- and TIR-associating SLOG family/SIR2-like domain